MQTLAEKVEALRTLLPLVEAHLALMEHATADYADAEEGEPPPAGPPPLPCDGDCASCDHHSLCRGEPWEREYRRIRGAYPIIRRLERLLEELMYVEPRWRCGVYYTLVQPWDEYDRAHRQEWCERGLEWMAAQVHDVPTYEPWGARRVVVVSAAQVVELRQEGCSIRQIARQLECSKSRVHQLLAAHGVRPERKPTAVG